MIIFINFTISFDFLERKVEKNTLKSIIYNQILNYEDNNENPPPYAGDYAFFYTMQ